MAQKFSIEPEWVPELVELNEKYREEYLKSNGRNKEKFDPVSKDDLLDFANAIRNEPTVWDFMVAVGAGEVKCELDDERDKSLLFMRYYLLKHKPNINPQSEEMTCVIHLMHRLAAGTIRGLNSPDMDQFLDNIVENGNPYRNSL